MTQLIHGLTPDPQTPRGRADVTCFKFLNLWLVTCYVARNNQSGIQLSFVEATAFSAHMWSVHITNKVTTKHILRTKTCDSWQKYHLAGREVNSFPRGKPQVFRAPEVPMKKCKGLVRLLTGVRGGQLGPATGVQSTPHTATPPRGANSSQTTQPLCTRGQMIPR